VQRFCWWCPWRFPQWRRGTPPVRNNPLPFWIRNTLRKEETTTVASFTDLDKVVAGLI
jgi:hypothetical protein